MKKLIALVLAIIMIIGIVGSMGLYADNAVQYSDLKVNGKDHWAATYIKSLSEKGVFNGYVDGTFKPDNNIRVDEFLKIVIVGMGYDIANGQGYWAGPYLDQAEWLGLTEDGEFPNAFVNFYAKPISRGEMARIIARAVAKDENISTDYTKYSLNIADFNDISKEYQDYVLKAFSTGIITGKPDGSFDAGATASRAEAATMLSRFINKEQRIMPKEVTVYSPDPKLNSFASKFPDKISLLSDNYKVYYLYEEKPDIAQGKISLAFANFDYFSSGDIEYAIGTFDVFFNENNKPAFKEAIKTIFPTSFEEIYKLSLEVHKKSPGGDDLKKTFEGRTIKIRRQTDGILLLIFKK